MNFIPKILLFIFISFLSVPTIVTLIEKKANVSICFSTTEEELHKNIKEIKADLKLNFEFKNTLFPSLKNAKIISRNVSKHDNVSEEIFSPPPNLIYTFRI